MARLGPSPSDLEAHDGTPAASNAIGYRPVVWSPGADWYRDLTPTEIDALALQGLGPDGQPLIDPATGLPVVPGPDMVLTPTTEPAPVPPGTTAAPAAEPPPPDLPPVGPIQFEDLSKLVGQWVKLKTYNGRTWQGQVKAVKGNEHLQRLAKLWSLRAS